MQTLHIWDDFVYQVTCQSLNFKLIKEMEMFQKYVSIRCDKEWHYSLCFTHKQLRNLAYYKCKRSNSTYYIDACVSNTSRT